MSDSRSFIDPFKQRLLTVFNASSSGDDPYRQAPMYEKKGRKSRKNEAALSQWESESQHLFEDFLSLDEEKITQGLAKAQVRKAMDRKYRRSSHGDQLEQEMRALEDTLEAGAIDPEITARKRQRLQLFLVDLEQLLRTRHPSLAGRVDLLSRPAWTHLAQQGLPPRFLLNLMMLAWYRDHEGEVSENPEALLALQLQVQSIPLGLRHSEIQQQIDKFTLDFESFESLLQQTLHALERQGEALESFDVLLRTRASQARRYFLQQLTQPYLDPDERLARYHIVQRYRRLRQQVADVRERYQSQKQVLPAEASTLVQRWQGHIQAIAALHLLNRLAENADVSLWKQDLVSLQIPLHAPGLLHRRLTLDELEEWMLSSQRQAPAAPVPGFVSDAVLEQDLAAALEAEDWATLEKWALLKAAYANAFRQQGIHTLTQQLQPFHIQTDSL